MGRGTRLGVLVLCSYQTSYSKALGKTGVLVCHSQTVMHRRATERADLFLRNYLHSSERIDTRLLKQSDQLAEDTCDRSDKDLHSTTAKTYLFKLNSRR